MTGNRELPPLTFDVTLLSTSLAFVWSQKWTPMIGVSAIDFALDVRAVMAGGGAVSLKPSLQYAA